MKTLVLVKPDAVSAGRLGAILSRYEEAGLRIVELEMRRIDDAFSDLHYAAHVHREFYPPLKEFMTSGPLVAAIVEGDDAVRRVRELNGATDPAAAEPGTVRADFGTDVRRNAVHASDSPESAAAEIGLWFPGR
ncbi:nucleoside-diphosphate kinase [Tessaracoccus sp. OH4464_COT-324]|uniref:nucleoside-diphosphate kinase n=1 Tax=Tessaracoccus sp. OH4464_COT-324 TaxID=2491059 RepID=UPI000F638187|nr:nucleoside-diphosphate kinase [Tessaracoccus sp. OH4464_COT-324]RRD46285.1 nucleoside-diphosphate kinase [Tessaracoccus sp. OH4464_COT-324]